MKVFKKLLLFFILLVPVAVYLFLQGFGKNQFDIPVFYNDGIDTTILDCGKIQIISQYYAQTIHGMDTLSSIPAELEGGIVLYDLYNVATGDSKRARNNMMSFLNKYKDENRVNVLSFYTNSETEIRMLDYKNLNVIPISESLRDYFGKCNLVMNVPKHNTLVLVDSKRRIRGYFDAMQLEEIDRLNTELYILLEGQYE